jgi:AraC-like DNA-binding protein
LTVGRDPETDPVDQLFSRHAFQRACVELAHKEGNTTAGRVGAHGVMFLSSAVGSARQRGQRLHDLADKVASSARRFGLRAHFGSSALPGSAAVPAHYQVALAAAEVALTRGVRMVEGAPPLGASMPLFQLRRQLGRLVDERPGELPAHFDRYWEAVVTYAGHRLEPARAHLQAGLEYLAGALLDSGVLDEKTFVETCAGFENAARDALTLSDLSAAYRRMVAELSHATGRPAPAQRTHGLDRAVAHIQRHYAEQLRLPAVARLAGFAPGYFSHLFKAREGMTFEDYVRKLRVERARQLLATTDLELGRVARISGFGTRFYLARVFKSATGMTPLECRSRVARYRRKV